MSDCPVSGLSVRILSATLYLLNASRYRFGHGDLFNQNSSIKFKYENRFSQTFSIPEIFPENCYRTQILTEILTIILIFITDSYLFVLYRSLSTHSEFFPVRNTGNFPGKLQFFIFFNSKHMIHQITSVFDKNAIYGSVK